MGQTMLAFDPAICRQQGITPEFKISWENQIFQQRNVLYEFQGNNTSFFFSLESKKIQNFHFKSIAFNVLWCFFYGRKQDMQNFKKIFSVYLKDNQGTFLTLILTFGVKIFTVKGYDL